MPKNPIGRGLQYRVYKISDHRVLKVPTTRLQKLITLFQWGYRNPIRVIRDMREADRALRRSICPLRTRMQSLDASLFGNPTFYDDLSYEQDVALPLELYFESHSLAENMKAVDSYIDMVLHLWGYGISDFVFNFTLNNAITPAGKVITIDVGELVFSKESVESLIREKKWVQQYSYENLNDTLLQRYFAEQANRWFTHENLDKYWRDPESFPDHHVHEEGC